MKWNKNQPSPKDEKIEKEPLNWKEEIISWIQIIVCAAVIAFVLNNFIIANSFIPSPSMENTIMTKDRVIGSRLSHKSGEPQRGDIAIFVSGYVCRQCGTEYQEIPEGQEQTAWHCPVCGRPDKKNTTVYYVKRVIGIPGDTVEIRDGAVYLNGSAEPLEEPYLPEAMATPKELRYEVPEGHYLMLGDNRNHSADARFWRHTFIDEDKIIAKVLFRYFPKPGLIK